MDSNNREHQPDWEQSLHRLKGLDVVVQLLGARHWVAKTSLSPICMAHGETMFEAILNLERTVSTVRMDDGNADGSEM
jgi:hypothetical protein